MAAHLYQQLTLAQARRYSEEPCDLSTDTLRVALTLLRRHGNAWSDLGCRFALYNEIERREAGART